MTIINGFQEHRKLQLTFNLKFKDFGRQRSNKSEGSARSVKKRNSKNDET